VLLAVLLGNASRAKIVAATVEDAPTGLARLWMLRRSPPDGATARRFAGPAFWSAFARAPVDVVFLDGSGVVVGAVSSLRPWRAAGPYERAVQGIVLEAGTCERVPVQLGDRLEFTPTTGERMAAGARSPEHP
jgi:uncharacterized membrane protein (UPF0127 family)